MTRSFPFVLGGTLATLGAALAAPDLSKLPTASDKPGLTYAHDIKPLFEAS